MIRRILTQLHLTLRGYGHWISHELQTQEASLRALKTPKTKLTLFTLLQGAKLGRKTSELTSQMAPFTFPHTFELFQEPAAIDAGTSACTKPIGWSYKFFSQVCEWASFLFNLGCKLLGQLLVALRPTLGQRMVVMLSICTDLFVTLPILVCFRSLVQPISWLMFRLALHLYCSLLTGSLLPIQIANDLYGFISRRAQRSSWPLDQVIETEFFISGQTIQDVLRCISEFANLILVTLLFLYPPSPWLFSLSVFWVVTQQYLKEKASLLPPYPTIPYFEPSEEQPYIHTLGGIDPFASLEILSLLLLKLPYAAHPLLLPALLIFSNNSLRQAVKTFLKTTDEHGVLLILIIKRAYCLIIAPPLPTHSTYKASKAIMLNAKTTNSKDTSLSTEQNHEADALKNYFLNKTHPQSSMPNSLI